VIYDIRHVTTYAYESAVSFARCSLRLEPKSGDGQQLLSHSVEIRPRPAERTIRHDFFGTHTENVLIETAHPQLVSIGRGVDIGARTTIIAHQQGEAVDSEPTVRIGDDVFIGPSVTLLPHVTIGDGAVVVAGSIVTKSVPPLTMVQGNPAGPVARCRVPLGRRTPMREFYKGLTPLKRR